MTVTYDGDALEMMHNGLSSDLKHHHYDVFQLHGKDGFDLFLLAQFENDLKGDIQRFSAQIEPMVDSIIFERVQAETE
jgi:hypothetical protein